MTPVPCHHKWVVHVLVLYTIRRCLKCGVKHRVPRNPDKK